MSIQQIIFGLLEFLISILISFVLIFGSYRLLLILSPRFDEERQLKKKNISVGIVLGGILLGEAIVVKQALYPFCRGFAVQSGLCHYRGGIGYGLHILQLLDVQQINTSDQSIPRDPGQQYSHRSFYGFIHHRGLPADEFRGIRPCARSDSFPRDRIDSS